MELEGESAYLLGQKGPPTSSQLLPLFLVTVTMGFDLIWGKKSIGSLHQGHIDSERLSLGSFLLIQSSQQVLNLNLLC